jgi:hypothetical protein
MDDRTDDGMDDGTDSGETSFHPDVLWPRVHPLSLSISLVGHYPLLFLDAKTTDLKTLTLTLPVSSQF